MKNIFFIYDFVWCEFDMGTRRIKLKLFITIIIYHFVITIIKRIVCISAVCVFIGVSLVAIYGRKSVNVPYFAPKNRKNGGFLRFLCDLQGVLAFL